MDLFKKLPTDQLLELLSMYTSDYTRMIKEGATHKEFYHCERMMILLQDEIEVREGVPSRTK